MMLGQLKRFYWQGLRVKLSWRKWQRRVAIGLLTLVFVVSCELRVAVRAVKRAAIGRNELAQAASTGQIEPFIVTGRLDQNSEHLQDGSYFNAHTFEGVAGQIVVIELVSEEFDTYLILLDAEGNKIAEHNDGAGGNNAQITVTLPEMGTYTVLANSYESEATGSYRLSLRAAASGDDGSEAAAAPADNPELAEAERLNQQAFQLYQQGEYAEAIPLAQQALEIRERILGRNHLDVATNLNNLASLYRDQGRYSDAEPLHQRALSIFEQQLGANHPNVATSLNNLAVLYFAKSDIPRGLELMNRASAIEETNLALTLAIGSEARKQAYIDTLSVNTNFPFSLHLQSAPNSPEAAQLALTSALRRKGRVLDAVSDNLRQLRQNLKPEDQALLDGLNAIRAQLGTLLFTGAEIKSPEAYRTQVATLKIRAEELENTLAQRSSEFRSQDQPVTIEVVQTLIPADAALVELVRYSPYNPKANLVTSEAWGTPHYAAAVLTLQGDPKWIDLGEAEPIDQLVEKFRESLRSQSSDVRTIGRELDAKIMQPIRPLLNGKTQVLLSPDSQLNLIPFAALVDEQNRYLIDNYTFTYLTSGRDLLKLQLDSPSRQSPVLLANPDYDNPGSSEVAQIANARPASSNSRGSETQRSIDLTNLKFGSLDGTQQEADAIALLLPNVTVLTQARASENVLKQLQAPSILHIATHGFFLQDIECVPIPNTRGGDATIIVQPTEQSTCRPTPRNTENPLLRSGLALAGFNPRQSGEEDGVLTALEASSLDLYGTKLVVMSACETGLGDVANGEGVYGLRRAFVMAGAESQLMSLWKVDDYGTSELMKLYYQRLKNGEGRSAALREVQQEMRQAPTYAHPYYWAGFIFSGDWSPMADF